MGASFSTPLSDRPALTAAQIGALLGKSPQSVRQQLRKYPSSGKTTVNGQTADTWHCAALPPALRARLARAASASGFSSVGEQIRSGLGAWKPSIPLEDCSDECLSDAGKLREALLPSLGRVHLASTMADLVESGLDDFQCVFGRRPSARHFYTLMHRTVQRDGGRGDWMRLELYLPERPARRKAAAPAPAKFPLLLDAINQCEPMKLPEGGRFEAGVRLKPENLGHKVFVRAFEYRQQMMADGTSAKRADRILRNFIFERKATVAPTREALKKTWGRYLEKWVAGVSLDCRRGNKGADFGGLSKQMKALPWFIPAAQFFFSVSNLGTCRGSVPEAVLRAISLPLLPAGWPESLIKRFLKHIKEPEPPTFPDDTRREILSRQAKGQKLLPASIARQIKLSQSAMLHLRSPREWALKFQNAPGSQRRWFRPETGQRELMLPGDWFGGDDSTPGIAVCVPCNEVRTPASLKYGVLLGRFQWLVFLDASSDMILSFDYVIRPRGSYRAEDILNGMGAVTRTHGIPRQGWQFEGGTWNSNLVKQAIKLLGCQHWRTYNPHQKAIEAVFNKVWTRLAVQFPHADMGRFRNENELNCKLYESCKAGHKDPRQHFPRLKNVLEVFIEEVAAHNARKIFSAQYGQWVPSELFAQSVADQPLRPCGRDQDWIFSPFTAERKIRGALVGCRVPMFEDFSVPFEFSGDCLPAHNGMRVRLHFNPHAPNCVATAVLLQDSGGRQAGDVLGGLQLVSETAQHFRRILGWGDDDQRAGLVASQQVANWARRETRGLGTDGRVQYAKSEERDGLGEVRSIHRGGSAGARPSSEIERSANRLAQSLATPSPDRAARRAELEKLRAETDHLFV